MDGQLFKELDELVRRISNLIPPSAETLFAMVRQIEHEWPDFPEKNPVSIEKIAKTNLEVIAEIPLIVQLLRTLLEQPDCGQACRHALVLPLVYLVRSDDLIPDSLDGGYGFVDDYIVLRSALSKALANNALLELLVQFLGAGQKEHRDKLREEFKEWIHVTPQVVMMLSAHMPEARSARFLKLYDEIVGTYEKCIAWMVNNPYSLEHRTQQLIDDPHLPGPVLTHPVDDETVWRQWELDQAEKRRKAMIWELDQARWRQKAAIEAAKAAYNLRNPVKGFYFPNGSSVVTDGRHVYSTPPKRGR